MANPINSLVRTIRNERGEVTGVAIQKAGGGFQEFHFGARVFQQGTTQGPGQHSYDNLTGTIGRQTQTVQPRPAAPGQAPSENVPARGPNEPAPPRGGGAPLPTGEGGSALPLPAKGGEGPSLPSYAFPPSPPPIKNAPPSPGQGFPEEKQATIYQQVLLTVRLFAPEKGDGTFPSASRLSLMLQQFKSLDQDCAKFEALVKQMAAQGKGISPEQGKQLNIALQALLSQFEVLRKQAQEALPQSLKNSADQPLPKDLQKAIAMLKERTDKSVLQMQNQLDVKLAKLAGEINLKPNAAVSASAEKQSDAKPGQKAAAASTTLSAAAAQSERGSKQAMTLTPSLAASESAAHARAEARGTSKPAAQLPQLVQSTSELHALNDKIQRKDLVAPLNVAVVYPFSSKEQNQTLGGVKTAGSKGKGDQSSEGYGAGGGGHTQEMVLIPAGPVILEGPFWKGGAIESQIVELDAFLIAAFPVTNEQFVDWLNEAMEEGKIKIDEKGIARDRHRNVLCKIHRAAPTSQIDTEVVKGKMAFKPVKGTESHPVVQVSWYGAAAYCNDNQFRLPTEAEWEKAAGMSVLEEKESLKKFRFGFGKDEVNLSWANYRDELTAYVDNRTSPVGFYNGETVFTKGGKSYQSGRAVSPHGCYDMSGNVRQWVEEEVEGKKVAKGGSYNSPPLELYVAARALFNPESCQSDTGFRVAFDLT